MRGSGHHQSTGSPSLNHGKIPREYASSRRAALKPPPAASRPLGSSNARCTGGNGSPGPNSGIIPERYARSLRPLRRVKTRGPSAQRPCAEGGLPRSGLSEEWGE